MNALFDTYVPDGFGTVNGYLFAENPVALIDFLKKAFYAEEINRVINPENGDLANVILKIGTSCFMVSQARGPFLNMRTAFYLYVDDVDEVHRNAVLYGAKVEFEPMDMEYQDRQSGIVDPSGNYWWISKRLVKKGYQDYGTSGPMSKAQGPKGHLYKCPLKNLKSMFMKKYLLRCMILAFLLSSCATNDPQKNSEKWKSEIVQVEQEFNDMAQAEGLVAAFHYYAAPDGVIRRKKNVIKGKSAIKAWYANDVRPNETLTWKPTFVEVSDSGDLAYTYGDYVFRSIDSTGSVRENTGIFHTVWKRQPNGEWRFVWD